MESDDLIKRYESLLSQREDLVKNKMQLEAELSVRKRSLKEVMEECRKAGYDPDNLAEELRKAKDVLALKLDIFESDLKAASEIIKPLMAEIQNG